jgi:diguanylate cyclase (GGDEF)-like protein
VGMKTKDDHSRARTIAAITLDTVSRLSNGELPPGVEELTDALLANDELKALADPDAGGETFLKKETLRLKKGLSELETKYGKIDERRRELASQLDNADDFIKRCKAFIRKILPILGQLSRSTGNTQLVDPIQQITDLFNQDAPLDQIESALQEFREIAFKTEIKNGTDKPAAQKSSPFLKLFKRQETQAHADPISHFREAYLEIVEELRLNLDQAALIDLSVIKTRLNEASSLDDFVSIRHEILALLRDYVLRISVERRQAATFILEVEEHLSEVEGQMLRSIAATQESREAGARFTDTIEKEMDSFRETVDVTRSLDELKTKIIDRISAIKKVIENSRVEDRSRNIKADKEMAVLRQNLHRMKKEIDSAKKRSETLEAEVLTDPLTQSFNRRAYDQRIAEELKRFRRYQTIFSIILLDVDHFKKINDHYGHAVGDLCLKEMINRIRPLLRETDFLARYGGEEFVVILPETKIDGTWNAAEKIRSLIEKTEFLHKGENVAVTISLGATQVRDQDKTHADIFERVDKAMYQAKQSGRNKVVML